MKKTMILFLILLLAGTAVYAMPPHPGLVKRVQKGLVPSPYGPGGVNPLLAQGAREGAVDFGDSRELDEVVNFTPLILLVDFSDKVAQVDSVEMDTLFFEERTGTLRDYYGEVSYNNFAITALDTPSAIGWLEMPQLYSYYVDGQQGMGDYPTNAQKLAEDAVAAADAAVDFSQYDYDGDGTVDGLIIVHAGSGAEFTGDAADIWSHTGTTSSPVTVDGVEVSTYSMGPEYWTAAGDLTIGVYAHHFAKNVFGVPSLVDSDGSSNSVGDWSLMASGAWNGVNGSSPAHPDPYTRLAMGFGQATVVEYNMLGAEINNVQAEPAIFRMWQGGVATGDEYFLLENRLQTGYDTALPGQGLLIWHVDEAVATGNDNEWYPGNTDSGHYLVALEQADSLWNLEQAANEGDDGDPFPGSTLKTEFADTTLPSSLPYTPGAGDTLVAVREISAAGPTMTADLYVVRYFEGPYDFSAVLNEESGDVVMNWAYGSPWGPVDTLLYDDGTADNTFNFAGYTHGVRMTPDTTCLLTHVQYYVTGTSFAARVYDWDTDNSRPSTTVLHDETVSIPGDGWVTVDVESANLVFDGEFVPAFGYLNAGTELGFDDADNSRSWDNAGASWSQWNDTYFIRAIVKYPNGYTAALLPGGGSMELDELDEISHFNVYRDGQVIAQPDTNTTNYTDNIGYGIFTYYVTAQHLEGESSPTEQIVISYLTNRPPNPFALDAPGNGTTVYQNNEVTLSWLSTFDPDADDFSYTVEWSQDPAFSTSQTANVAADTFLTITDAALMLVQPGDGRIVNGELPEDGDELNELPDDTELFWRVEAVDENGAGRWALPGQEGWSFLVAVPEPPAAFDLVQPADGDVVSDPATAFVWQTSLEPDPGDSVTYHVEFSTSAAFAPDSTLSRTVNDTVTILPQLQDNQLYYWRVKAMDTNSEGTWSTSTWTFTTELPQPPTPFGLLGPADGTELGINDDYDLNASWEPSVDPDPADTVRYDLLVQLTLPSGSDSTVRSPVGVASGTSVSLVELFDLGLWDGTLNGSWWVEAVSGADTVQSNDTLTVVLLERLVSVEEGFTGIPTEYAIAAAYPNPFNPTLTVVVALPAEAELNVAVYDLMGRQVARLAEGRREAGYQELSFDGSRLASGVYFVRAQVPGELNQVQKVVLMK